MSTSLATKKVRKHPVRFELRDDSSRMQLLADGGMARLTSAREGLT